MSGVLGELAARGSAGRVLRSSARPRRRLCEAVAIIKDGRLVAAGRVEELRRREVTERVREAPLRTGSAVKLRDAWRRRLTRRPSLLVPAISHIQ